MENEIEFYSSPKGKVIVETEGERYTLEEKHHEILLILAGMIKKQYPEAWNALSINYKSAERNSWYYLYKRVSRFILCNMGKMDALSYDVENGILHIEDIICPIRRECQFNGIVCHPKPFKLTNREEEIVKMRAKGETYKEISEELNLKNSTIKNLIQNATKRMELYSSKDLVKMFASII
ncbi:MAG: LuxR C-terminal-related transcriptional regulator [Prevotella sp.]|jgi:DNA-binding CsgD family transcriptional regulator|nr:LuxR C-terminal-related transcriptional regulator [Prevotella sp.]